MTSNWVHAPLIEHTESVSTGPFGSMLHKSDYVSGGVPLINPINIVDGEIHPDGDKQVGPEALGRLSSYVLKAGDIVVGRRGEIGRCAVVADDQAGWVCGTGCFFIRPRDTVDPHFLAHLLRSPGYRTQLELAATGATMKNMSNTTLAQLVIGLPSQSEQRRIVALLDEAFEGIATAKAHAEQSLCNAKALLTARLTQLFRPDCQMARLTDLATSISDGDHAPPPKASVGVPFITISNIEKNSRRIDFSDTFLVPQTYFDGLKSHRRPQPGDVLYTVTGSFGIPVLVEDTRAFCFQRHIGLVRPKPGVDGKWLSYALLSPLAFEQADAGATGTAQRTVSLNVLRNIQIPKLPIEEQCSQARELDVLSSQVADLARIYQRKLTALAELKQSLLHQAFTGQL